MFSYNAEQKSKKAQLHVTIKSVLFPPFILHILFMRQIYSSVVGKEVMARWGSP